MLTASPGRQVRTARARGETYDTVPCDGLASSSPTIRKVCSRPSSRRSVTVMPNDTVSASADGWTISRARAPRPPVAYFAQGGSGSANIALSERSLVGGFKTAESRLYCREAFERHKVAVTRYRPVRQIRYRVLSFLDKGATHAVFRWPTGWRLTLAHPLSRACGLLIDAFTDGNSIELRVCRLLFVQISVEQAYDIGVAEFRRPSDDRAIARNFIVLHGLG